MRRFRRRGSGRVQLRMPPAERTLLQSLVPQLRDLLDDPDMSGRRELLLPTAYADPDLEAEFRRIVGDDLVAGRRDAAATVLSTLERGSGGRVHAWGTELDADETQAWLSVLQDLRKILAHVQGVETETDWETLPHDEPGPLVLHLLAYLQEELLEALAADLDGR